MVDHIFGYLLIAPSIPIIFMLDWFGIELLVDGGPVEPFVIFSVATSIITWILAGVLSAFWGWWIIAAWAIIVLVIHCNNYFTLQ
jgi:hypothetical protein